MRKSIMGCQGLLSDKLITELDESWNQETIDYRNVSWFFGSMSNRTDES